MNTRDPDSSQPLPDWVEHELANMEDPPEEFLQRYDYLKDDFLAAIQRAADYKRRAAAAARSEPLVEVVFSLGGELLDWARGLIDRHLLSAEGGEFAFATARSPQFRGTKGVEREQPGGLVSRVSKSVGEYAVEVATYRQEDRTEVEVDVLRQADKVPVRPFAVEVLDIGGRSIMPAVHIGPTDQAPRFPGPEPGMYVLNVSWQGGATTISVEFK